MPLTDTACRRASAEHKQRKFSDSGNLYLLVKPNGSKLWRLDYTFNGKRRTLAFGAYPAVGLQAARRKRDEAKVDLANGKDPGSPTQGGATSETFEQIGREWLLARKEALTPKHVDLMARRLDANLFPEIGRLPIAEIEAPTILAALRKMEDRGVRETAHRMLGMCGNIFRYAIATGRASRDPSADLKGALKARPQAKHQAALTAAELPDFFQRLSIYDGDTKTRLALELTVHTMTRTNEVRFAKWSEISTDVWRIPADRMKMNRDHMVPITPATAEILGKLRKLAGDSEWIAPGARDKPMSENTMLYALYRMGYHSRATTHGFRGTASTILNESGLWSPDAIERQLAHVPGNAVRSAYNAAQYWDERRRMMAWWSTYLCDQARLGILLG